MIAVAARQREAANPIDTVEELAALRDWFVDRPGSDEATLVMEGAWTSYHVSLDWRADLESLHLACSFDLKVPRPRRDEVCRLIALINEQLYFGHFDLWQQEGTLIFRHGLLLSGGAEATAAQCETLIDLALESCERYFPAFQFAIWAGRSADDAIAACLVETQGEA